MTPNLKTCADPELSSAYGLYVVNDLPAPLFACVDPDDCFPWQALHARGVRWVLCLCSEEPDYNPAPVNLLEAVDLEDLSGGRTPKNPGIERREIRRIARAVTTKLWRGQGVLVHCVGGRGRTGTVIGSALVGLGYDPGSVIHALDQHYKKQERPGWPESPWQAETVRKSRNLVAPDPE